jgi:hypothetical protein
LSDFTRLASIRLAAEILMKKPAGAKKPLFVRVVLLIIRGAGGNAAE